MRSRRLDFDVVVVGAGPAGLAAATTAAEAGRRVVVLESTPWIGGQIWRGAEARRKPPLARSWLDRFRRSGAQLLPNATVFAAPAAHGLQADTPGGVLQVNGRKLVLATGARELFLPFPGWTLPGVLGPGGLQVLAKAGWPVAGKRLVVAGSGPLLLAVADALQARGARVSLVAEQAPWAAVLGFGLGLVRHPGKLAEGLAIGARLRRTPYRCACWPVRAEGRDRVERVTLTDGRRQWTEPCDLLACGFHLVPNLELPQLLGCESTGGAVRVGPLQETSVPDVFCAGEPTGVGGVECALTEGQIAGLAAAGDLAGAGCRQKERAAWEGFRSALRRAFALRSELRGLADPETIVCRCEDVRRRELQGFEDGRAAKLHTRCGMGTCQGRVCGAATAFLFGWETGSVRPPLFPVSVDALFGSDAAAESETTPPIPHRP